VRDPVTTLAPMREGARARCCCYARAVLRASLVLGAVLALSAPALADADLFSCRVIVTGTDMRSRPDGLRRCVREVIVKATGRPSLQDDARIEPIVADAPALVEDFVYLDRMTDIPRHDEQGSRDRPYDLVVHLNPEAVTERLQQAGLSVWRARPVLAVTVAVTPRDGNRFDVTAEGDASERQRQALLAAADRFGMRVALPTSEQLGAGRLRGGIELDGSLVWSPADFGWNAEWRLAKTGTAWEVRGASFDEAYRAGIGGAAERLSQP